MVSSRPGPSLYSCGFPAVALGPVLTVAATLMPHLPLVAPFPEPSASAQGLLRANRLLGMVNWLAQGTARASCHLDC